MTEKRRIVGSIDHVEFGDHDWMRMTGNLTPDGKKAMRQYLPGGRLVVELRFKTKVVKKPIKK